MFVAYIDKIRNKTHICLILLGTKAATNTLKESYNVTVVTDRAQSVENDNIFAKDFDTNGHVWQTFAQYFPPGLEKPSV